MEAKNYPVFYRQGNYPEILGTSDSRITIAQSGCFVTSFAMKATFYKHPVTPPQLNQLLVDKKLFVDANLLTDDALSKVYDDIKYIKTFDYEPIPTDLINIKNLLADAGTTVTIRINLGSGNLHFVEAIACDGVVLHIANPLSGSIEDFSQRYGNPVTALLHVLVYYSASVLPVSPPPPSPAVAASTPGAPTPLATSFNNAIVKSNNFDKVADFLGINAADRVQLTAGDTAVAKFEYLQQEVEQLQNQKPTVVTQTITVPASPLPQVAPSAAQLPVTPVSVTVSTPTFANGKPAVASDPTAPVPTPPQPATISQTASGSVSPWEFFKALIKTLLF